jgi:hypothetical protein
MSESIESISSASQTVATQLTDLSKNITLNIRYLLFLVFTLLIFVFYFSSLFSISLTASSKCKKRGPLKYAKHRCSIAEGDFSSNEYFSNIDSDFKSPQFQSIPLTAPDSSSNNPLHLMFGQADKYVTDNAYSIKINANLYVLDGNIFDIKPTNEKQSYNAYLIRKDNSKIKLGDLLKDGDGLYKLTFSSNKPSEFDSYKFVAIYYNDKTPLLIGGFK